MSLGRVDTEELRAVCVLRDAEACMKYWSEEDSNSRSDPALLHFSVSKSVKKLSEEIIMLKTIYVII